MAAVSAVVLSGGARMPQLVLLLLWLWWWWSEMRERGDS